MAPITRRSIRRRPAVRWFFALVGSFLLALIVQVSGGPPETWVLPILVMLALVLRRRDRFVSGERRRAARAGPRTRR